MRQATADHARCPPSSLSPSTCSAVHGGPGHHVHRRRRLHHHKAAGHAQRRHAGAGKLVRLLAYFLFGGREGRLGESWYSYCRGKQGQKVGATLAAVGRRRVPPCQHPAENAFQARIGACCNCRGLLMLLCNWSSASLPKNSAFWAQGAQEGLVRNYGTERQHPLPPFFLNSHARKLYFHLHSPYLLVGGWQSA